MILEDNPSYGGGVPVAANTHTPAGQWKCTLVLPRIL
jgi:hypothetical protein